MFVIYMVCHKEQKSKEWLNQRLENITTSEVDTIMGITPVSWGNKINFSHLNVDF